MFHHLKKCVVFLGLLLSPISVTLADADPPPVVASITPTAATAGVSQDFSVAASDNWLIDYCYLVIDGTPDSSNMSLVSGTANSGTWRKAITFSTAGEHTLKAVCRDFNDGFGNGPLTTIVVSAGGLSGPVVGAIRPTTATVNVATTYLLNVNGESGLGCSLYVDGAGTSLPMTISGPPADAVASRSHTFNTVGTHTLRASCSDSTGVARWSPLASIAVSAAVDSSSPLIGTITPATGVSGSLVTITAEVTDDVGVTSCSLSSLGGLSNSPMTLGSGRATKEVRLGTTGSETFTVRCYDAAGNMGIRSYVMMVTAVPSSDAIFPSFIGGVSPVNVGLNTSNAYSIGYVDNVGVTRCQFYADYVLVGDTSLSGTSSGTATRVHTFNTVGTHVVRFECEDAAGNRSGTSNVAVTVSSGLAADLTPPAVSTVSPLAVTANNQTLYSVSVSDNQSGVSRCELFVNGISYGAMDVSGTTASRYYLFAYPGSYSIYARCWDAAGNSTNGPVASVNVSPVGTSPSTPGAATMGSLMKAVCPPYYVGSDHPCRAVYYFGRDGRRHAFPNSRVYFTWYPDFSSVIEVSDSFLASIPLGRNVTYRPGMRLVKFTTLNRVYAVGRGGVLRWVASEEVARQLYGYNWAQQVDDIADVFYTNYVFGSDINVVSQYTPATEAGIAFNIDQNW